MPNQRKPVQRDGWPETGGLGRRLPNQNGHLKKKDPVRTVEGKDRDAMNAVESVTSGMNDLLEAADWEYERENFDD